MLRATHDFAMPATAGLEYRSHVAASLILFQRNPSRLVLAVLLVGASDRESVRKHTRGALEIPRTIRPESESVGERCLARGEPRRQGVRWESLRIRMVYSDDDGPEPGADLSSASVVIIASAF